MCQLVKCVEFEIRSYVATFVSVQTAFSFVAPDGTIYDQGRMVYKNNEGIQFQVFSGEGNALFRFMPCGLLFYK